MKKLCLFILFVVSIFATAANLSAANKSASISKSKLLGEWVGQIDIPQNDLTILLSFNFLDANNCIVSCKWIRNGKDQYEETGKAKYSLSNNQLVIDFLNEDELIRHDHVFHMHNVYDIKMKNNQLVICRNRQFRGVDVYFGKGYKNRGFSKIIFE